jgi:hypothetical protein
MVHALIAEWLEDPETPDLSDAAVQAIRDLIFMAGGVSDAEALILLNVVKRLAELEQRSGADAARLAAQQVKEIWLQSLGLMGPGPTH